MYWIENRNELERIREDARIAIDRLQAIIKECNLPRACVPYLMKKADDLKFATNYIVSTVEDADKAEEGVLA